MIRKIALRMLAAQIAATLTVSLCMMIDNVIITRYLGVTGVAAYELANPVLLVIGAIAGLLASGIQVACGRSLGAGARDETDRCYSSSIVLSLIISFAFLAIVVLLRDPLVTLLGSSKSPALHEPTKQYMIGFASGAPGSMFALVLAPFMQMAGQSGLLLVAVLGMTVADIGFDLLAVNVLGTVEEKMLGIGLASSASYYVAVLIGLTYFLSRRRCAFHFSRRLVSGAKMLELFRDGLPLAVSSAASVVLVFVLNQLLLRSGGDTAVAAYAIISSIGNAANAISTGTGGVSLTLTGIFHSEQDRTSLRAVVRLLCRMGVVMGLTMGVLLGVFAPRLIDIFLPERNATHTLAVTGLRLFALGLIPCCINNALKSYYQGIGRVALMEIYAVAESGLFPALAAFVLSLIGGPELILLQFIAGQVMALGAITLYTRFRSRAKAPEFLLLQDDDFGAGADSVMEADISEMKDVTSVAEAAERFCEARGESRLFANRIALCVEEMGANVVQYGFEPGKKNHLSIRILRKDGQWVLRFRDDCAAFDPVSYVPPEDRANTSGIRMVLRMADDVRYVSSLNLNNLTVILREKAENAEKAAVPASV